MYRACFEPGVHGWPEHACIGCSMLADQIAHLAHLNARSCLDLTALGRQERWEDSPPGYPQTPPYGWWNWHDRYGVTEPSRPIPAPAT
jgi:predicted dithiol-disulfide oxidoreductase (DUF899 family)